MKVLLFLFCVKQWFLVKTIFTVATNKCSFLPTSVVVFFKVPPTAVGAKQGSTGYPISTDHYIFAACSSTWVNLSHYASLPRRYFSNPNHKAPTIVFTPPIVLDELEAKDCYSPVSENIS